MNTATHTGHSRKHLYRIVPVSVWGKLNPLCTGVEFWDTHTSKWRPSIMCKHELVEIKS